MAFLDSLAQQSAVEGEGGDKMAHRCPSSSSSSAEEALASFAPPFSPCPIAPRREMAQQREKVEKKLSRSRKVPFLLEDKRSKWKRW